MIDILNKFYDIKVEKYKKYNEGIIFFVSDSYYYFTKCYYDDEFLKLLFNICNKLRSKGIKLHDFVYNKNNELISEGYILFKVNVLILDVTLKDIEQFNMLDCNQYKKDYVYMDKFWEDKIDYLEMQLSELSFNKLINNSFDYYVGIAEILISYLKKNYIKGSVDLRLSHKSFSSLNSLEFYNPLNISFDHYLKDIAAFIRLTNDYDLLNDVIDKYVNKYDYSYFFVRMTFPFIYFYEMSNVLIDGKSDIDLINIVNNIDNYEIFLGKMEELFGINIFSWIKKE